jgi:prophage antirepressor-like protein
MDILQQFVFDGTDHEVRIVHDSDGEPFFVATDIAKVLGIGPTHTNQLTSKLDSDEKGNCEIVTPGGSQNMTVLTEAGVYRVIMRSNKEIARPFQKWICQILKSIRLHKHYSVDQHASDILAEKEAEIVKLKADNSDLLTAKELELQQLKESSAESTVHQNVLTREEELMHNTILDCNDNRRLLYMGKIKIIGDKTLIKIGATEDVKARTRALRQQFGSFHIFKVFILDNCYQLEEFIKYKPEFQKYKYKEEVYQCNKSTEIYLMPEDVIHKVIVTIQRNMGRFLTAGEPQKRKKIATEVQKLHQKVDYLVSKLNELHEDDDKDEKLSTEPDNKKGQNQNGGVKVQKYSEDGGHLLKTYFNKTEAVQDDITISMAGLKKSINFNLAYNGARWANLDNQLPDDTVQALPATVYPNSPRHGHVALLNADESKIVHLYLNGTTVARVENISISAGIKHVREQTGINGKMYLFWEDVDQSLRDAWEGETPEEPPTKRSRKVQQFHPTTGVLVQTFPSMVDVERKIKVSAKTIKAAVHGNFVARGYKWKFIEPSTSNNDQQ